MQIPDRVLSTCLLAMLLALGACAHGKFGTEYVEASTPVVGPLGMLDAQLAPEFWIERLAHPDDELLTQGEIEAQNQRMLAQDDSMHDLQSFAGTLERAQVAKWLAAVSSRPRRTLYDADGHALPSAVIDQLLRDSNAEAIPTEQETRFGLVVQRSSLRTFPGSLRAFAAPGELDIDRLQESALFPGTPVVIAHASRDGKWLFVVSPNYIAWVAGEDVAQGPREMVLGYARATPFRVVTGARVATVHTPELPALSRLELDMGSRLPMAPVAEAEVVNGQNAYTSWPVQLPIRDADGSLALLPALLQKNADTHAAYLALTRANTIRQAFKFLGERYGWGHDYDGRDCSGFVSEVYRSMGVALPRNTGDQADSPVLDRETFNGATPAEQRLAAVARLAPGDLVYIPGHVLMVVGRFGGRVFVIHDTSGGTILLPDGKLVSLHLNAVAVTPLEPLRFSATESYIDRMTSIVHIGRRP